MDIDIVVMWVDGNDPLWCKEKQKYCKDIVDDSNSENRFRDSGLMKYWFRSISKFAPWVRTIHFVTWGHLPNFLNISNSKINVVYHKDYMPLRTLPSFNACALEMNLFRIENLSEHFVFFNDDMFLLHNMGPNAFFSTDGLPCIQYTEIPTFFKGNIEVWQMHAANDMSIINKYFNKSTAQRGKLNKYINIKYNWYDNVRSLLMKILFPDVFAGFKNFHAPAPFCKSTFKKLWELEPELLMQTSNHKFRDYKDVNQWLALWWQMAEGNFSPRRMNSATFNADDETVTDICKVIRERKYEMICINDPFYVNDFEYVSQHLQKAFEDLFPDKCEYEL